MNSEDISRTYEKRDLLSTNLVSKNINTNDPEIIGEDGFRSSHKFTEGEMKLDEAEENTERDLENNSGPKLKLMLSEMDKYASSVDSGTNPRLSNNTNVLQEKPHQKKLSN